ncbi:hypothetical protein SmJEL517_g05168 [Synchytrium microbalum]|uniref:F-box domain-containing protein n=1 Tax=Synchytrium microbalum TaxID=1806994 RepID=A0A507BWQ8_9FUNG|nr:uncharacterized protein SmJEL517_g05168 [Synchytrium microbalum]TPX31541.1 hypothetical protein SmJEL517_g05168 [Synchytrium microbalum]
MESKSSSEIIGDMPQEVYKAPLRILSTSSSSATLNNEDEFSLPSLPSTKAKQVYLPNEIYLLYFQLLSTTHLLTIRLVSHRLKLLVDYELDARMKISLVELSKRRHDVDSKYVEAERVKRPHLRHYRQFLFNISAAELSEATSYKVPPPEIKTVCECLCLLRGGNNHPLTGPVSAPTSPTTFPNGPVDVAHPTTPNVSTRPFGDESSPPVMSWSSLKKLMTRYDFRTWLTNLRAGVDYIPISNVRRVERIIMLDPTITYENLRQVSMAGYKLLIIVAAVLQYCTIAEDLRVKRRELSNLDRKFTRCKLFLGAISGSVVDEDRLDHDEQSSECEFVNSRSSVSTLTG